MIARGRFASKRKAKEQRDATVWPIGDGTGEPSRMFVGWET